MKFERKNIHRGWYILGNVRFFKKKAKKISENIWAVSVVWYTADLFDWTKTE